MSTNRASAIGGHLKDLRRYAWAFTGAREAGDTYVAATLEAVIAHPLDQTIPTQLALYRVMYTLAPDTGRPLNTQQQTALLLQVILGFTSDDVATIMQISEPDVQRLSQEARQALVDALHGQVFIAADSPQTRQTLGAIMLSYGHHLAADAESSNLILADGSRHALRHPDKARVVISDGGTIPPKFANARVLVKPYTVEQVSNAVFETLLARVLIP